MVIANAATGGKGIPQPEVIFCRQGIRYIRKCCRALVGRYHQIGVFLIFYHHLARADDARIGAIVCDIKQTANKYFVALDALLLHLIPGHIWRDSTGDETPLCTHRDNNGVFNLLRLYQAQHFSAEIFGPV